MNPPEDIRSEHLTSAPRGLDPLTGLPDRGLVAARLDRALADGGGVARETTVLCVDLDGFERVNADHGRAAGDQVLIETGRRLGRSMRASNIVGRLNEDMFAVVIPDMRTDEQVIAVANRLIQHISEPFHVKGVGEAVVLTASVGIAIAPENGDDADTLIANAADAVDLAKRTGTGTYQFFTNKTGGEVRERRSRVSRLRRAIAEGHLALDFQPKVSLATGMVVGAEALVRWHDPASGRIMPGDFIPLAEDAGLIEPLGAQVLADACAVLKSWQTGDLPFLRMAVNVSAREIARPGFFADLKHILDNAGVAADALELEITESSVMQEAEEVIQTLRDIRAHGVHLTADDFGTGYASLSYLRNFPLDGLKIDTTFVGDIESDAGDGGLAAAVIAVGHCLGLNVVAEGVETQHQLNYLRWRDCDEVQGYLISAPLPADGFAALAASGRLI